LGWAWQARTIGPLIFLFATGANEFAQNFFEKNKTDNTLFDLPRFRPLWWLRNQGLSFFLPRNLFFNLFFTQNTFKTL
jgi:hypothetical protein